jgi:hypothetical protein
MNNEHTITLVLHREATNNWVEPSVSIWRHILYRAICQSTNAVVGLWKQRLLKKSQTTPPSTVKFNIVKGH